jgi:CRP/FNR family cyclic AMP-dependent transcriptional regulator
MKPMVQGGKPARAGAHPILAAPVMSPNLSELAERGVLRQYRKGTILIEEGDRGDALYIILSGRLRAYSAAESGREITFGIYGPGEYLGEMSLDGGPRSASVETVEPSVCSVIMRPTLDGFIDECPSFAFELLSKVIRRARAATLSAKNLALNNVYGSLKQFLEAASRPGAAGTAVVAERLTHQDIANRLGCSREMVSRVMKDLEGGGYVRHDDDRLVIVRPLPARW